jgi:hypothetical protein
MPALCPLLSVASLILHLAGAPVPAITCLSLALVMLPPVQCLIKLVIALGMTLIVGAVDLLLRLIRGSDRLEDFPLLPASTPAPATVTPGPTPGQPAGRLESRWHGQARPGGELTWQGQASPFLGRSGKRSGRGRP